MLGNVTPALTLMSEEEKSLYKAYYCGVCSETARRYGNIRRFALTYDIVFFALLCDALSDEKCEIPQENCVLHPVKKRGIAKPTKGISLRADLLIIFAYEKLRDDARDEKGAKKQARKRAAAVMQGAYGKVFESRPGLCAVIAAENENQRDAEKNGEDTDDLSLPASEMAKAVTDCIECKNRNALTNMRTFLGRYIYLLDAMKDRKRDAKSGSFNIFNRNGADSESAEEECYLALSELSYWYSQLDIRRYKGILDNIIYSGLESQIILSAEEKK